MTARIVSVDKMNPDGARIVAEALERVVALMAVSPRARAICPAPHDPAKHRGTGDNNQSPPPDAHSSLA